MGMYAKTRESQTQKCQRHFHWEHCPFKKMYRGGRVKDKPRQVMSESTGFTMAMFVNGLASFDTLTIKSCPNTPCNFDFTAGGNGDHQVVC